MTIIEADGVETQPLIVDSLVIFAGQRYSLIVEANQTIGNYCKSFHKLIDDNLTPLHKQGFAPTRLLGVLVS